MSMSANAQAAAAAASSADSGDQSSAGGAQQALQQKLKPEQMWVNLTPFPYQKDIYQVVDALGLSRRFGHLQDRVIFFRPYVKRKCPNGIMTDRVVFITPNGLLHLCDNDAAPKRTLELPQLLSVVTDSISQIALITDWPLVIRFETPKFASQLPFQLPTLKLFVSLVKFYRPNASLLRCTPEDFSTINLNLGKPRQFRAPTSFDVLAPPPERPLSVLLEEQQHGHASGKPNLGGADAGSPQQKRNADGSPAGSPGSPVRRQVQFANEVGIAEALPGDIDVSGVVQGGRAGGGVDGKGKGNQASPTSKLRRPDAPAGPTDFWAVQQGALYDQITRDPRVFDGLNREGKSMTGAGGGAAEDASPVTPVDNKVDKPFRREVRMTTTTVGEEGEEEGEEADYPPLQQIVIPEEHQHQHQHDAAAAPTSFAGAAGGGGSMLDGGSSASGEQHHQGSSQQQQQQQQHGQHPVSLTGPSHSLGAPQFGEGGPSEFLGVAQGQHASSSEFLPSVLAPSSAVVPAAPERLFQDEEYFRNLPTLFAGRTSQEVNDALENVARLERHNDELRNEIFELELREKRMNSAPVPLGRVVPAKAAIEGAKVRNLGVLIMSICRRRKQLNEYEAQMAANLSLMSQTSTTVSSPTQFDDI